MRTGDHILNMTTRDGALVSAACTCGRPYNQARTIGEARECQREHVEDVAIVDAVMAEYVPEAPNG